MQSCQMYHCPGDVKESQSRLWRIPSAQKNCWDHHIKQGAAASFTVTTDLQKNH